VSHSISNCLENRHTRCLSVKKVFLTVLCICHTPPVQPWTPLNETTCISCHAVEYCRLLVRCQRVPTKTVFWIYVNASLWKTSSRSQALPSQPGLLCQITCGSIGPILCVVSVVAPPFKKVKSSSFIVCRFFQMGWSFRTLKHFGSRPFGYSLRFLSLSMYSRCHAVLKNSREKTDIWNYPKGLYIYKNMNVFLGVYMNAHANVGVGVKSWCFSMMARYIQAPACLRKHISNCIWDCASTLQFCKTLWKPLQICNIYTFTDGISVFYCVFSVI